MGMSSNRIKLLKKKLLQYKNLYGISAPYNILVDGTFCNAAVQNQVNISEQIPKYFQEEVKIWTTKCAIQELGQLGHKMGGIMHVLKQFAVIHCDHEGGPISVQECFELKYKHNVDRVNMKFCVATQDIQIQKKVRKIGAVPLLYLHFRTPTLAGLSQEAQKLIDIKCQTNISEAHSITLDKMKSSMGIVAKQPIIRKKRKYPKGPNPLSCKKKKKQPENEEAREPGKKRARKRRKPKSDLCVGLCKQ